MRLVILAGTVTSDSFLSCSCHWWIKGTQCLGVSSDISTPNDINH